MARALRVSSTVTSRSNPTQQHPISTTLAHDCHRGGCCFVFQYIQMKITLYQQDIAWLDPAANYAKIESVLASNPDTDLLVLPEMCATGFVTRPALGQIEAVAEVEHRLLSLASRYGTAICGSFAVTLPESADLPVLEPVKFEVPCHARNRNRCYFVTPEGEVHYSDKHHLFNIGGENQGYVAGNERRVVEWRGIRFLLLVCYDLRFPVWSRNTESDTYDVMICVANWPQQRRLAWETLLAARAIENQAYVIGVNRVGQDRLCPYDGGTRAVHPYGHIVAQCQDNVEETCSFVPDIEKLEDFRKKFPSHLDCDLFTIAQ